MEHTPELEETDSYLQATDFARAWMLGLIPAEEVYREMMGDVYKRQIKRRNYTDLYPTDHAIGKIMVSIYNNPKKTDNHENHLQ